MAITKTAWTDIEGTDAAKTSVAAGVTETSSDFDCNGANPYLYVAIKVVVVFGGTPDDDVRIQIVPYGADDSPAEEDTYVQEFVIPSEASAEHRRTFQIFTGALDTIRVKTINDDTTDAITVWIAASGMYPS